VDEEQNEGGSEIVSPPNKNLALTLVVFSWCAWTMFQTAQLVRERNHLTELKANQETTLKEATRVRAQIEAIAADTAKLAAAGNPGAQRILSEFRRRGFKVATETEPVVPAKQ
jgi:hypothetical protein